MNLIVKYTITDVPDVQQLTNDTSEMGNAGVNFAGCISTLEMGIQNGEAAEDHTKGSILSALNSTTSSTYVDKIISILMPATINATTYNHFSVILDKLGINSDIIGVEFIGLTRVEDANTNAYFNHSLVRDSLFFHINKRRLFIAIPCKTPVLHFHAADADLVGEDAAAILALMNAARKAITPTFQNAYLNLRITYKN